MPGIDRFHPLHAFAICNEKFSFSVVWVYLYHVYYEAHLNNVSGQSSEEDFISCLSSFCLQIR